MNRVSQDRKEDDRCNDGLEAEKILDLGKVSKAHKPFPATVGVWLRRKYLGVRDAQERKLEKKIKQKCNHSGCCDALVFGNMVCNVCEAGPDGSEQQLHALATCSGLDAEPDNGENAA